MLIGKCSAPADAVTLARLLKEIVTPMRVEHYHKYPSRSKKGPKTHRESAPRKHVSTHRLLHPHLYKSKVDP